MILQGCSCFGQLVVNDGRAVLKDFSEKSFLQGMPVVLSATRLSQPIRESPNAMMAIDRAMIKSSSCRNIQDQLKLVLGMYATY